MQDVTLELGRGEILGLVGESGSGKTTTALALLGYSSDGVEIVSGTLEIGGQAMSLDDSMRGARGADISYVPQNPGRSLNPSLRIADAIEDVVKAHRGRSAADGVAGPLLTAVGLPDAPDFAGRFPHQLSGGQQQRVSIAMALSCEPSVVVLDEPTTGLDVVTQERVLSELIRLRDRGSISMIYVTHDLAVVAQIADRIAVMYAGQIVEQGRAEVVLRAPRHPYTRGLLSSIPDHVHPRVLEPMRGIVRAPEAAGSGCVFAERCPQLTDRCGVDRPELETVGADHDARCFHWTQTPAVRAIPLERSRPAARPDARPILEVTGLAAEHRSRHGRLVVASDISFTVDRGACVALVGESGSGKTTIARVLAGLHEAAAGRILLDGAPLPALARKRSADQRRRIQLVAQNPTDALNPLSTAGEAIGRAAKILRGLDRRNLRAEVQRLLDCVRLPAGVADRYPRELSGGERQRVAIARALAADPQLILCDEITSALDVSVQAAVLNLLNDLRTDLGLSLVFITHDLGVVATVADVALVLEQGAICERGAAADVLDSPQHPYTRRLMQAAPSITSAVERWTNEGRARELHTADLVSETNALKASHHGQ